MYVRVSMTPPKVARQLEWRVVGGGGGLVECNAEAATRAKEEQNESAHVHHPDLGRVLQRKVRSSFFQTCFSRVCLWFSSVWVEDVCFCLALLNPEDKRRGLFVPSSTSARAVSGVDTLVSSSGPIQRLGNIHVLDIPSTKQRPLQSQTPI